MIELNLRHVLLFIIVIFLLYHLIGDCGDPFSIGGPLVTPSCNNTTVPSGKICVGHNTDGVYNVVNNEILKGYVDFNISDGDCIEVRIPDKQTVVFGLTPLDLVREGLNGDPESSNVFTGKCSERVENKGNIQGDIKNYTKFKDSGYIEYTKFSAPYSIFVEDENKIGSCNPYVLKDIDSCDDIRTEGSDEGLDEDDIVLCNSSQDKGKQNCFVPKWGKEYSYKEPVCMTEMEKCTLSQETCNKRYCNNRGSCSDTSAVREGMKCNNCCGHSGNFCQTKINDNVILRNGKCAKPTCNGPIPVNQPLSNFTCDKGKSCTSIGSPYHNIPLMGCR